MRATASMQGALTVQRAGMTVLLIAGVVLPFLVGHDVYKLGQLEYIVAMAMIAVGLNIVLGFAGQLFLGPTGLFGISAYMAAYLAYHFGPAQSLFAMCLVGVAASLVVAVVIALPALRVSEFYLGMMTFFLALMVPTVFSRIGAFGGASGISLVLSPTFVQMPTGLALYEAGIGMLAAITAYSWLIRASRLGRQLAAIRSDQVLAASVGMSPYRAKLASFLLAAVPCGLAAGYYVYSQQFITPDSVAPTLSIYVLAGVVIGGSGTIAGPVVGTGLVIGASQFLGAFQTYQGIIFGVLLVLVAIAMPSGLVGGATAAWHRLRRTGPRAPDALPVANLRGPDNGSRPPRSPLAATQLRKAFGGVQALNGVSITLKPGQVHAVVGPNGSGKTTLLNVLSGYYPLDGGEIRMGEVRMDGQSPERTARSGIGRTFQTPKLLLREPTIENIVIGADHAAAASLWRSVCRTPGGRAADKAARARASRCAAAVGLRPEDLGKHVIPHGKQRLVEVARALAMEPDFIFLDEPAAGLSIAEVAEFKHAVTAAAAAGIGVLIVEHNLPIVFELADEVTVLHQGEVIARGTPAGIRADAEVARVYLGQGTGTGAAAKKMAEPS
jgi:ABC-type branched-subunit amino acid transport system ATPase component/ABC-type branched-subunit amino acid transport system permease subunit